MEVGLFREYTVNWLEADPIPDQVVLLSQEIYTSDLLQVISLNLYRFEFEAKKDFTSIFNTLLRRQVGDTRYPTVEYLAQKGEILLVLTKGYCRLLCDTDGLVMKTMKLHWTAAPVCEKHSNMNNLQRLSFTRPCFGRSLITSRLEYSMSPVMHSAPSK